MCLALAGIKFKIEAKQRCCAQCDIAVIEPSPGGELDLKCINCGTRRGQMGGRTAEFLGRFQDTRDAGWCQSR